MKKLIFVIVAILCYSTTYSQTVFDANIYGSTDMNGTARYMSMAGAFGALGGNASAIIDNPAGLGIYRKSELSTTLNLGMQNSNSTWYNTNSSSTKFGANFSNLSYVIAAPTWRSEQGISDGLINSNWSISYNKVKNFARNVSVKGGNTPSSMTDYMNYFTYANTKSNDPYYLASKTNYEPYDNTDISWLSILAWNTLITDTVNGGSYAQFLGNTEEVTPTYQLAENGYINKYSLAWSGNFSNKYYLGVSLDYTSINHSTTSTYNETFGSGGTMSLKSNFSTTGGGFGLNIGTIIKPIDNLRIGLALHTPTIFSLTDHTYSKLQTSLNANHSAETPNDVYYDNSFFLQSPMQLNASIAYIFGKKGMLSAEYVYNNSTGMKLMDSKGNSDSYNTNENKDIANMLNNIHTIKLGFEYGVTDNLSIRGGYAFKTASTKNDAVKYFSFSTIRTDTEFFINNSTTNYFSAGLGYKEASWYVDLAFMKKMYAETFYPFDYTATTFLKANSQAASIISNNDNIVATLGFKF